MTEPRPRSYTVTGLLVAAFLILWLLPWAVLIVGVPMVLRTVHEAGLQLPALSREVIELGMLVSRNAVVVAPPVFAFGLAVCGLAAALRHRPRWGRTVTLALVAAIAILLLVNAAVGFGGVVWPQMKLVEAMKARG